MNGPDPFVSNVLGTVFFLYLFGMSGQIVRVWRMIGRSPLTAFTQGDVFQRLGAAGGLLLPLTLLAYPLRPAAFDRFGVIGSMRNLPCRLAGLALLCLGGAVVAVAFETMRDNWRIGPDSASTKIVREGIYARVRHPIYAGLTLFWLGVALLAGDLFFLGVAVLFAAASAGQAAREERHMRELFKEDYAAYQDHTSRFFPWL